MNWGEYSENAKAVNVLPSLRWLATLGRVIYDLWHLTLPLRLLSVYSLETYLQNLSISKDASCVITQLSWSHQGFDTVPIHKWKTALNCTQDWFKAGILTQQIKTSAGRPQRDYHSLAPPSSLPPKPPPTHPWQDRASFIP